MYRPVSPLPYARRSHSLEENDLFYRLGRAKSCALRTAGATLKRAAQAKQVEAKGRWRGVHRKLGVGLLVAAKAKTQPDAAGGGADAGGAPPQQIGAKKPPEAGAAEPSASSGLTKTEVAANRLRMMENEWSQLVKHIHCDLVRLPLAAARMLSPCTVPALLAA